MQQLSPELLLQAYSQGVFPMGDDDGSIYWYDPDPRTIIPLDKFHCPRSLARRVRKGGYEIRYSTAFREVMEACAAPAADREKTWITPPILDVYCELHEYGFAHSVETWVDGEMVGGLYGVTLRGLFAGESMFSHATDASKIALVHLVERLRTQGYILLDTQFTTPHLARFGAVEIPQQEYKQRLSRAMEIGCKFIL